MNSILFSYFFYKTGDLNDTLAKKSLTRNNMEVANRSNCNVDELKPSEDQLTDLAKDIVGFWKHLARKLHVGNEVERIQKDHNNFEDIVEKANAMLLTWLEIDNNATVVNLREALFSLGKKKTALKHFPM